MNPLDADLAEGPSIADEAWLAEQLAIAAEVEAAADERDNRAVDGDEELPWLEGRGFW
jgi:hypothetical protein